MPTTLKTDEELKDLHFTRDPSLAADIADAFGGGGGDATAMIQGATLRYPEALTIANDLGWNQPLEDQLIEAAGGRKQWYAEVAEAAEMESIISATVRGNDYIVFQFGLPDGRVGKDVLYVNDDGSVEAVDHPDTPERAALRAQVLSTRHLRAAKSEADQIIEDARQEAQRILQEASAKAADDTAKLQAKAAEAAADDDGDGDTPPADTGSGQPVTLATSDGTVSQDIDAMDADEAKATAERLGLEVEGTGKDGFVKKSDYQDALKKHAASQGSPQS